MRVSFIIPTMNERANVEQSVESAWRAGAAEVIVVDGGSTDGTLQIAERLECKLVRSNAGRATQQNAAAARATGDVLLFQHADTRLIADGVSQIESALVDARIACGAFKQRIDAAGVLYRWLECGNAFRVRRLGVAYGDQGLFIRRDLFTEVGGFPNVPILEDLLLLRELRRRSHFPVLLEGPLQISARRWQKYGVIRQTMQNWRILALYKMGVAPEALAGLYRRHDTQVVVGSHDSTASTSKGHP